MALIGINPSRPREKGPSTLEKIAIGLDIANKAVGTTLAIPNYLLERDVKKAQLQQIKDQGKREDTVTALEVGKAMRPAKEFEPKVGIGPGGTAMQPLGPQYEKGAVEIPGHGMMVPRVDPGDVLKQTLDSLKIEAAMHAASPPSPELISLFDKHVGGRPPQRTDIAADMVVAALQKEGKFQETFQREAAEGLVEALNQLDTNKSRLGDINRALVLLDKVTVGPISAGFDWVKALRRVLGDKFQLLETLLNKQGVEAIADFASRAGARAIDSDKEREYLAQTFPGVQKRKQPNITLLLTIKSLVKSSVFETEAKDEHRREYGNLDNYVSPLRGKKTYYEPGTWKVQYYSPGSQPQGWLPLSRRLVSDPTDGDVADHGVLDQTRQ